MKLRKRAAAILDATHAPHLAYRGPYSMKCREYLARWLDGKRMPIGIIRRSIEHLESTVQQ